MVMVWMVGCHDDIGPGGNLDADTTVIVSDRVPSTGSLRVVNQAAVFVSLPPGTIPNGGFATISDPRAGSSADAAMDQGGFDPVPLQASAGDTIAVSVRLIGGATERLFLVVPARRPPVVVRTDPPPKKRDVPLNSTIVVVFSEPVTVTTGTTIELLHNGSPVSGSAVLSSDGLRAEFQPDQPLAANSDYALSVPGGVTDLTGDKLGRSVTAEFTTGTTIIAASVVTDPVALLNVQPSNLLRTFEMQAIRDGNGQVSGTFTIFYPETGVRVAGRVTCFTIVGGDSAWLGGVIATSSNSPRDTGMAAIWRTVDNGTPTPTVHDQLSLVWPDSAAGVAHDWCANTPALFPDSEPATLSDVQVGNVVINASGAPPPPLPPPPPAPPPDSTSVSQVVFWSPYEAILAINSDGTNLRTITTGSHDQEPVWSPDGRHIAFERDPTGQGQWSLYLANWDGSGIKRLTADSGAVDQDPAWSPNGQKIAFTRSGSIHVMNADGTGLTRLSFEGFDSHPSWSPDGSRIVFASSRTGANAIHVMNADGSNVIQLTSDSAIDYVPSWSPDGSTIAFQRYLPYGNVLPSVYTMNPDGSGRRRLSGGGSPTWSPDSRRILYELFSMTSMSPDGSGMKRLGSGFSPSWSRLGRMPDFPVPFRSVEMLAGDGQTDTLLAVLPESLSVRVVGDDGSPQAGALIQWDWLFDGPDTVSVPAGLSAHFATTNAAGVSAIQMHLGSSPQLLHVRAALLDGTARTGEVVFTETTHPKP